MRGQFTCSSLRDIEYNQETLRNELIEIFLENSKKNFNNELDKNKFCQQWFLPYWERYQEYFFVLWSDDRPAGYLTGHPNTISFVKDDSAGKHKSYELFQHLHREYPAHFHLNLALKYTGQGGGEILVKKFFEKIKDEKCVGAHVVTAPDARNIHFYQKLQMHIITDERNPVGYIFVGVKFNQ